MQYLQQKNNNVENNTPKLTDSRLSSSLMSPSVSNIHINPSTEADASLFTCLGMKCTYQQSVSCYAHRYLNDEPSYTHSI